MATDGQDAYCTLLMSDSYLPGAMVLAHSLKDGRTKKQLAVLVTLDSLSAGTIEELRTVYDQIIPVERITNRSPANLYLMDRPDLSSTFTKIALWRQTQFRRIVYIDADVVALRAPDELFARESTFAAVPDIGWPDCFNSGVLALTPNMGDYYALRALADRGISFDGADQGLLNMHFRDWDRLSFTYNCTPSGNYQYVPAYRHFQSSINMVHYIGKEKPWNIGRDKSRGGGGVYEELVARWWAVYERHYRAPSAAYIAGQAPSPPRVVQQHVIGETASTNYGFSSSEPSIPDSRGPEQEQSVAPIEPPLTEQTELVEAIDQGEVTPVPTVEQRQFSAPMMDWDPRVQAPPPDSRPEAANFPNQLYNMSDDRNLFQAPKAYPEPPKDMWYEVPKTPPANERPKPIFPWEEYQSKPTRIFADDGIPSPELTPSFSADDNTQAEPTEPSETAEPVSPSTPTIEITPTEPFASYSRTNAWDEMPEIERYISALQSRRSKVQVLLSQPTVPGADVLSPSIQGPPRRPSIKLTDFPTEFERPSLPVTPAPVRRPTFWGDDQDDDTVPGAEGVPRQEDWDPLAKLEELQRRQSEVLAQGPTSPTRTIPDRILPEAAALSPTSEEDGPRTSVVSPSSSASQSSGVQGKGPVFQELDFGPRNVARSGEDEGVFSPTE